MFYTPRFSYGYPETVICACPRGPRTRACAPCWSTSVLAVVPGWCRLGGYTGWVIPGTTQLPRAREHPQIPAKRAPEAPSRGWSGWVSEGGTDPFARDHMYTWTSGPTSRAGWPGQSPAGAFPGPPRAKGRDSVTFPRNLVKTMKCHQKVMKRPVIVPISKTGSRSHLLKF